jgi:cytochrome P450
MTESVLSTADTDPHPFFDRMRAAAPVSWDEGLGGWIVLNYELCRHVLVNEQLFRHPYADADETLVKIKGGRRNLVVLQGAEHERMRRYVLQLFSPRNVEVYIKHHVVPVTQYLIDRFGSRGRADLYTEFATQLPSRVLMSLFGMDAADDGFLEHALHLHDVIMTWAGSRHYCAAEQTQLALAASEELNSILLPYLRARREQPRDDLVSRLWAEAPALLEDATEEDMLATCRELYLGGSDTTVHALSNAIYVLLTEPAIAASVRADRDRALSTFLDEVLRVWGSVQYRSRVANQDIELAEVAIKKDQVVFTLNAAANRDPAHYPRAAEIDVARSKPRDHLAFNAGPRACVGMALARAEMRVALEALLDRLVGLELDPLASPPRFLGLFTRSFRPLNVAFVPELR